MRQEYHLTIKMSIFDGLELELDFYIADTPKR